MILHTTALGAGPPVALLHGLFGRSQNLAAVARGLAGAMRVISIDLRNHGASPHAAGMDYRTLAADVLETLAAADALPAALLGHSMGGKAAMAASLLAPASVRRLLVADIAPVAYAHHNAPIAAAMLALDLKPGLTRAEADQALQPAVPDAAVRGFLLQNLVTGASPSWRIGLRQIADAIDDIQSWPEFPAGARYQGPSLFVSGGKSDYVRPADHETIKRLFPAAEFSQLPEAGHWLHADQPQAFLAVAEAFLSVCPRTS